MSVSVLSRWPPVRKVSDRGRDFELDGAAYGEMIEHRTNGGVVDLGVAIRSLTRPERELLALARCADTSLL